MHGVNRNENSRITDGCRSHAADSSFGVAMMMHIGIIQHDLATTAQPGTGIGFRL